MNRIKSLVKDTAIYGLSSIIGRFIGYLLVPLYTASLASTAEYGIVTNTYSWVALGMILLTYGMETGFFRFVNNKEENALQVYSTVLGSLAITSSCFIIFILFFYKVLASFIHVEEHPEYIILMGITLSIDAFSSISFAYLRNENRPYRFATIKIISILLNVGLNLFFLILIPYLAEYTKVSWIHFLNNKSYFILYIFISNFISSTIILFLLSPFYIQVSWRIHLPLLKRILNYSLPLLVVGIAAAINESGDKILYPYLANPDHAQSELGVYGANYKLAAVIIMFTQAFRFAFEPFIFSQSKTKDVKQTYARVMTYFTVVGLISWLGMVLFIDEIAHVLVPNSEYYEGLRVVPIVLAANLFLGIYYNLSVWYKLSDKTSYAAYFAIGGAMVTLIINVVFVGTYGYIACAWATFCSYAFMLLVSYFYGRIHYPVPYQLKRLAGYTILVLFFTCLNRYMISSIDSQIIKITLRVFVIMLYIFIIAYKERFCYLKHKI